MEKEIQDPVKEAKLRQVEQLIADVLKENNAQLDVFLNSSSRGIFADLRLVLLENHIANPVIATDELANQEADAEASPYVPENEA